MRHLHSQTGLNYRVQKGRRALFGTAKKRPTTFLNDRGRKVQVGQFESFDGTPIYYEVVGEGPPLLFCYGLVCNIRSFCHQEAYFRKKYQCIFFDYRGHQKCRDVQPSSQSALQTVARDMRCLLAHLGHKEVVVIGHSMGVNVALHFFLKYPSYVSSMVWINGTLQNPFAYMFKNEFSAVVFESIKQMYLKFPNAFSAVWDFLTAHKWMPTLFTLPFGFNILLSQRKDMENYIQGLIDTPHTTLMEYLIQMSQRDDVPKLAKLKNTPVLICAGERDLITPFEKQNELVKHIPQCKLVKISHGSHSVHLDMPQLINVTIDRFLKEHA